MNSSFKRRHVQLLGAALGLALAVALGIGYLLRAGAFTTPAAPLDRLSVALPMLPHSALLLIAQDKGYVADEGIELAVTPVTHGKAALEHLEQGKADLALAADAPILLALMKGEPLAVAASVHSASGDSVIVARRDRGIAAPRDLAGKKVGVSFGTGGEYFLSAYLIRHKLAPDSLTRVNLPPGQIVQALGDGSVDAVATWSPIWAEAQSRLGANAVLFAEADIYTSNFMLVGRGDFLKGHPRAMQKLMRALLRAEMYLRSEPEQGLQLVAARLKVDANDIRPAWQDYSFNLQLTQSHLTLLESQARWAMDSGYAASGPVPNFLPNLYLDALLAVKPEHVTVVR